MLFGRTPSIMKKTSFVFLAGLALSTVSAREFDLILRGGMVIGRTMNHLPLSRFIGRPTTGIAGSLSNMTLAVSSAVLMVLRRAALRSSQP